MKKYLFHLLPRLFTALLAAWWLTLGGLSWIYLDGLTTSPCPLSAQSQDGYDAVQISSGGHSLAGWWRPPLASAQPGRVMLILGGAGATRDTLLPEARMLAQHGYGILTIDQRSCAGLMGTFGYREVEDLQAMVDFALSQPGVTWVGVMGFSVGGVTAVRGAARIPDIQAVIALGNFANLYDEMTSSPAAPLSLNWQLQRMVALVYFLRVGIFPSLVSPIDDLPRIAPRPLLLIHGENEAERTRAKQQIAAAVEPKALWIVPGVGHGGYIQAYPDEFEQRVIRFLEAGK